ncbi:putative cytochrome P450 [Exophiala viscosa]|uniref:Cytochrome P450 n=1 Tax=Exophiala viscosa TaxID=2486360 RepID=A0AAN6DRW8_9EURO|nr:putative cytochrome P450 [Exophiala viscosa]
MQGNILEAASSKHHAQSHQAAQASRGSPYKKKRLTKVPLYPFERHEVTVACCNYHPAGHRSRNIFSMKLIYAVLLPFVLLVSYRSYRLIVNYAAARRLGVPIILLPVSFEDAWWTLLKPLFAWVQHLPWGLGLWYDYSDIGWPTEDGYKTVSRLGDLVTTYPPAIERIYKDTKTFIRPDPFTQIFAFYGQNLTSQNGQGWQRHRKITAPAFNEQNMRYVWDELHNEHLRSDFELLAMHVLTAVGFGQDSASLTSTPPGHRLTLMQALSFILRHIFTTIIFGNIKIPDALLPSVLRQLKVAVAEFRLYMQEAVLQQMNQKGSKDRTSLLGAMVSANEAEKQVQSEVPSSRASYLTDDELYGNIFLFKVAGFETTAVPYLAAYPEIQDWVREEVDAVLPAKGTVDYAQTYPKLVRCLAVLYETLRTAGHVAQLVRAPSTTTMLPVPSDQPGGHAKTIAIEPNLLVSAHFHALHLSPRWGPDSLEFKPQRFVAVAEDGSETLTVPQGDSAMYAAWSFSPIICPGKKFSQVEFVAVVAYILSRYRIEPHQEAGETTEGARARLMGVLDDKYFNISTHLKRPEAAKVRFVKR